MSEPLASEGRAPAVRRLASIAIAVGALAIPAAAHSDAELLPANRFTTFEIASASSTSVTVRWDIGRAPQDVTFEINQDGTQVAATAETSHVFTGLFCGTAYTFGIVAIDSAGNRSEPASVIAAPNACDAPDLPTASSPLPPPEQPVPTEQPTDAPHPATPLVPATPPEWEPEPAGPPRDSDVVAGEMPWSGAGAFVWHETDIAPETLGAQLRDNGFSWVAVRIHDGLTVDPIEDDWVRRFRAASGLPVGGWGVLRTEPEHEADLAHTLLDHDSLDFYIANPEAEYKYSNDDGQSGERFGRSQRFVERFRTLEPDTPAAVSSYCRADTQDIDWRSWSDSSFVFLPQAYVNDLGAAAAPRSCVEGAVDLFPAGSIHPTVGVYAGQAGEPDPELYAALLDEAGTVGFSVYLAETRMDASDWMTFGTAIGADEIARRPDPHNGS